MQNTKQGRKIRRIIAYSLATVFFTAMFIGLLIGMQPMLLPIILGGFLAYLFKPLVNSFRGTKTVIYARALSLLLVVGAGLYYSFTAIKASLPNEKEKLQLKVRMQYKLNDRYATWMGLKADDKGNFIYKNLGDELDAIKAKAIDYIKLSDDERKQFLFYHQNTTTDDALTAKYYEYYLANMRSQKVDIEKLKAILAENKNSPSADVTAETSAISAIMTTFSHWIIFPLAFIFLLLDKGQIVHFFMRLVPNRYFELTYAVIEKVDEALGKYIRGTMIECLLVGLTLFVGFFLCGLEFKVALFIGALGGITNAIPFVGTFIACAIGAAYSLIAENITPVLPFINENNLMIAVVGVVMVAHLLDNAIYQPLVVGSAVNIHPLVVVLGVFGGSMMFGFAGLIFAIPTIVIIKVVTETLFTGLKEYRII